MRSANTILVCIGLIAVPPLLGQGSTSWLGIVEAGYANDGSNGGLGLVGGGAKAWRRFKVGASYEAIFGTRQSDRYFEDTFSSTQTRCRDGKTGQFTSSTNCNTVRLTGAGFVMMEGAVSRAVPLIVGGGYRIGARSQPVAVIGLTGRTEQVAPNAAWRLTAVLGNDYASVRVGVTVPHGPER